MPRWQRLIVGFFLIVVLSWHFHIQLMQGAAAWLARDDRPYLQADAIIVLMGDAAHRMPYAAELFRQGLAVQIWLAPTDDEFAHHGVNVREAEFAQQLLMSAGVPASAIHIMDGALCWSTRDEALRYRDYLRSLPQLSRRVLLVTSWSHSRRAAWTFAQTWRDLPVHIAVAASPVPGIAVENWWRTEMGFDIVFNEYVRWLYNWLHHFGW